MKTVKTEQQACEAQKEHYEKQLSQLEPIIESLEQILTENNSMEQLQLTIDETTKMIEQWQAAIHYKELQVQITQMALQFQDIQMKYEEESKRLQSMKEAQNFTSTLTTFERIHRFFYSIITFDLLMC